MDNIKHHQGRIDKQEEYKFQMFKMKEEDVKLRYTNYNFQKQMVQTAKEKKSENYRNEKDRIILNMQQVTHIIDGKKLDFYEIDDRLKMKGSQLMNSFLKESLVNNSLFMIQQQEKD